MTKKFILFTVPKSASNYFGEQLNKMPNTAFLNILHGGKQFQNHFNRFNSGPLAKTGVFTEFTEYLLSDERMRTEIIRLRLKDPIKWIEVLMSDESFEYLGGKIHPWVDLWSKLDGEIVSRLFPNDLIDLCDEKSWQIITMSRKNEYDQIASEVIGALTLYFGEGDLDSPPEIYECGQISVEALHSEKLINAIHAYKKCYQYVDNLRKSPTVIHLWYEDIIEGKYPKELLYYFNVEDFPIIEGEKLFKRDYKDVFEDYNELIEIYETLPDGL